MRRGLVLAVVLASLAAPRAHAQTEPAPPPASDPPPAAPAPLTPPRLISPVDLTLPEGATVSSPIDLLLTIDGTGLVTEVTLTQSYGESVDSLIIEAARSLRFEPARRGEQPITAKVRFQLEVAPPTPPATGPPTPADPAQPATQPPPVPSSNLQTLETIEEERASIGATARVDKATPGAATRVKLRGRELTMIPGTFGEPLRVVATLPGVSRSPFGLGFFLVRGAAFQNTGFLVDGFQVPLLYHLGAGPAIISSRLVDQLDFYPGGYPVSFGRFNAGVISLRTAPPPTDRFTVELEVDLLRASGLAIVPIGDGDGSVAVAFRRSYFDLLLPLITDDITIAYTDYQLRFDYKLTERMRVSVFFFGSRDELAIQAATGAGATVGSQASSLYYHFDQLIVTIEHKLSAPLTLRWAGTIGPSGFEAGRESTGDPSFGSDVGALRLGQRVEAIYAPSELAQTTLGVEESIFIYEVQGSIPSFAELPGIPAPEFVGESIPFEDRLAELAMAPYLEQVVRPWRFEITGGLRAEYFRYGDTRQWAWDPRGVIRFKLTEEAKLKAATGLFSQPPLPPQLARQAANPYLKPNRSWQSSFGTEIALPYAFEIDSSLFYSHMWQLTRPTPEVRVDENGETYRPFFTEDGKGRAYGFELLLRRKAEQGLFGWLSYTLSRSERFLEGGDAVVFAFDQTHVLNFAASYAVSGWTFGARFTLATGRPVQDILDLNGDDAVYDADEDDFDPDSRGRRIRLPTFHQLDVRIDREWRLGPVVGSVFLDIMNVYNAKNSEGFQYNYDFTERGKLPGIPFLPTIGVKGVL
jgi:hypothetical protein